MLDIFFGAESYGTGYSLDEAGYRRRFWIRLSTRGVIRTVEVPAPDDPVMAMMQCCLDMVLVLQGNAVGSQGRGSERVA